MHHTTTNLIHTQMTMIPRHDRCGLLSLLVGSICLSHTASYPLIVEVPENANKVRNSMMHDRIVAYERFAVFNSVCCLAHHPLVNASALVLSIQRSQG